MPMILLGGIGLATIRGRELDLMEIAVILVGVVVIVTIVIFIVLLGGTVEVLTQ